MTRLERTPEHTKRQDTAKTDMGHTQTTSKSPEAVAEYHHDKREITLYHSDLNDDILENPALYIGPTDF